MGKNAPLGVGADSRPPTGDQATNVYAGAFAAPGPSQPIPLYGQVNVALWASAVMSLATTNGSLNATVGNGSLLAAGDAVSSVIVPPGTTVASIAANVAVLALPSITLAGTLNIDGTISGLGSTAGLLGAAVTGPNVPTGTTVSSILNPAFTPTSFSNAPPTLGVVQTSMAPTRVTSEKFTQSFTFALTASAVVTGTDAAAIFTGANIKWSGAIQLEYSMDGCATWLIANYQGGGNLVQWTNGNPTRIVFGEPERGVWYRLNCTALASGTINFRFSATGQAATSLGVASPI